MLLGIKKPVTCWTLVYWPRPRCHSLQGCSACRQLCHGLRSPGWVCRIHENGLNVTKIGPERWLVNPLGSIFRLQTHGMGSYSSKLVFFYKVWKCSGLRKATSHKPWRTKLHLHSTDRLGDHRISCLRSSRELHNTGSHMQFLVVLLISDYCYFKYPISVNFIFKSESMYLTVQSRRSLYFCSRPTACSQVLGLCVRF